MKKIISIIIILIAIPIFRAEAQQSKIIDGIVYDAYSKQTIIGATVVVKDVNTGVATDVNGRFSLRVNKELPLTIVVSYIGYIPQEVLVFEPSDITIPLVEDINKIQEVVVVGYTQSAKEALTSAISTVKMDEIANIPSPSITEKLQGSVAGLLISSNSGVPGTSNLVRLRGATSISAENNPIYIVDGVFINTNNMQQVALGGQQMDPLSDLNPDDIESVTVLKDASATAAYGARGANGVILITTKRGSRNSQTRVNFKSEFGLSKSTNLWDLVTGPEHAEIVNINHVNDGRSYETRPFRPVEEVITGYPAYGTPESQQTYDRIPDVFRTAQQQTYNLSVTGGDDKTNFYIGGEYTNQEATLKLQDFERLSGRINLDHSLLPNLRIGTSNLISSVNRLLVRVGDGPSGLFQAALHTPTFYPVYNNDGSYNKPVSFDNHIAILENSDAQSKSFRSTNNIYAKWNITDNLSFKSSWSNDRNIYHEKFYYNTFLIDGQPDGRATDATRTVNIFGAEQLLNFIETFGTEHTVSAFLGNSYQKTVSENSNISGTGFPSNQFKRISSAASQTGSTGGTSSALLSFFGGANYSYGNRYSIDFTLRADGSSRVGSDNRWGYFPAVGLSWNLINEKFFPKKDFINDFKLKGSIGLVGNESISDFGSLALWSGGSRYDGGSGIAPSQLGNSSLKWETTRQWNIGLNTSLLKNRIEIEFNYYNKYTYDLLLSEAVPDKTGFSSVYKNSGEISNKGVEFQVNSLNVSKKNKFTWRTTFAISRNKNIVEKLPVEMSGSYTAFRLLEGYPIYSMWVYNYLGVNPQTGDAIYENLDDNPDITVDDKKIVGDAWPDFEGSLKNTFTYKNFSFDFSFYYKYGNEVFNYTRMFLESGGTRGITRSMQKSSVNYWKNPGDTDVLPRPKTTANSDGSTNYEGQSSRVVEDGSYIRLRNVTLAYALPARLTSGWGIQRISFYVTGSNLLLFTKYTGPDPEVNVGGDSNGLVQSFDFGTPPQPKTILAGLNITF